jgi:hypothetical protein
VPLLKNVDGSVVASFSEIDSATRLGKRATLLVHPRRVLHVHGVALKLHAEKKPNFDREVALV